MTTRNLVPRADSQGKIGISGTRWEEVNAVTIKATSLQNSNGSSLLVNDAGIKNIATVNNQLVIALDGTFLTDRLGFNADSTKPDFTLPNGDALPNNTIIAAGDSLVAAIQKLNDELRDVAAPSDLTVASFDATAIVLEGEGISNNDNDTTLPTSAAVKDYVDSQLTSQDLDFQGDAGGALAVDLDSQVLTIAGGTGLTSTGANQTLTLSLDDTGIASQNGGLFLDGDGNPRDGIGDTASIGSATLVPVLTLNKQGQVTATSTAAISTSFTLSADAGANDTFENGGTLTFAGDTGITTTVSNDTITIDLDDTDIASQNGGLFLDGDGNPRDGVGDTASIGSATLVPVLTLNKQGQVTATSTAAISTSFTISDNQNQANTDVFNNGETLTFAGSGSVVTTVSDNNVAISLSSEQISLGGVNVSLGGTDATPAFDLQDAINYPAASLSGSIAFNQLAGNAIQTEAEISAGGGITGFGDNDTSLLTAAAIKHYIDEQGFGQGSGDISRVNITAGTGLSGSVNTAAGDHVQTISLDNTGIASQNGGLFLDENGDPRDGVGDTASIGSGSVIPVLTLNKQGQVTATSTSSVSIVSTQITDFTEAVQDVSAGQLVTNGSHSGITAAYDDAGDGAIDLSINKSIITGQNDFAQGESLASGDQLLVSDTSDNVGDLKKITASDLQTYMQDNLTFTTNTDEDVSKANLSTRLASFDGTDTLNIGDADNDTSVVIRGNLTVKGTTTTVDSTTINVQNSFTFEGATPDEFETVLSVIDPTDDRSITLPDQNGSILVLRSDATDNEKNTAVTSTPAELNLLDGSAADTVVNEKAVIYSNAGKIRGDLTGNADTATTATNITASANNNTNETVYLTFVDGATGEQGIETDVGLTYNPSTGELTSTTFSGALDGNATSATTATTAASWSDAVTVTFANGDVTGSFDIDGSAAVNNVDLTIADGSVESSMLVADAVGADQLADDAVVNASIAANAAIDLDKLDWTSESAVLTNFAQDDKLFIYDTNVTTIKSMTLSNLEDSIFGNVSGDITIAAGGDATIGNLAVTNAMLEGSIADDKLAQDYIQTAEVDGSSIEFANNSLNVRALGITNAMLAGSISNDKLNVINTDNKVSLNALNFGGGTATNEPLTASDLLLVSDVAAGEGNNAGNKKATLANLVTFLSDNTSLTSLSSLATVGTITSGTWQGEVIVDAYVANDLTISGGTVNNSVIGGTSAAAGTFTALTANTSLTINNSTAITSVDTDLTAVSQNHDTLTTAKAVKTYVDAQITAQDLDFATDTGAGGTVDLDSETLTIQGTANKVGVTHAGQTITVNVGSDIVQLTAEQTLTNKTLTSPIVSGLSLSDSSIVFEGATSNDFETTLSVTDPTDDRVLTLPDATDTLVGRATTDTLTNKSIDADNNTVSNLEVDNLKAGVLDTDLSAVAETDTTLASAKAIKAYVDSQLGRFGGVFLTSQRLDGNNDPIQENGSDIYDVVFDSSPLVRSHFGPFAFDLGQLHAQGGSDLIFYGATATGASDRHFLVVGSGDDAGDTKFTGANENTP